MAGNYGIDLREFSIACHDGHGFTISLVGLGPKTAVVCPTCADTFRYPAEQLRALRQQWEKDAKDCPDQEDVATARAEIRGATALDVATVLPRN